MRNKHLLLVFVAMLGLAFVYPTSLSAQISSFGRERNQPEKKESREGRRNSSAVSLMLVRRLR